MKVPWLPLAETIVTVGTNGDDNGKRTGRRAVVTGASNGIGRAIAQAFAAGIVPKLRLAMLVHGVDIIGWPGGTITAAHDDDLAKTIEAFWEALLMLKRE